MNETLPVGKLPMDLLDRLLGGVKIDDPAVLVGPGVGEDAAVIRFGDKTLLFKTDPITFATDDIARYLVMVNSNDIACMGGTPRYMLVTMLLPEGHTTEALVEDLFAGLGEACAEAHIALVGGHTEITYGLERPIAVGFMIGELTAPEVVRTGGARPGNSILVSKGIPLEACSLLARELPGRINADEQTLDQARRLILEPGISVVREARLALEAGGVTAMHDPTEGGLATGLMELSRACGCGVEVVREDIPELEIAQTILSSFDIDPLGAIASGSLLLCCEADAAERILAAWRSAGIPGAVIGTLTEQPDLVLVEEGQRRELPRFAVDEIARIFAVS